MHQYFRGTEYNSFIVILPSLMAIRARAVSGCGSCLRFAIREMIDWATPADFPAETMVVLVSFSHCSKSKATLHRQRPRTYVARISGWSKKEEHNTQWGY